MRKCIETYSKTKNYLAPDLDNSEELPAAGGVAIREQLLSVPDEQYPTPEPPLYEASYDQVQYTTQSSNVDFIITDENGFFGEIQVGQDFEALCRSMHMTTICIA